MVVIFPDLNVLKKPCSVLYDGINLCALIKRNAMELG